MAMQKNQSPIRVFFAIPSMDEWKADTAVCFANMCLYTQKAGIDFRFLNVRTSILADARNKLVQAASEVACTHVLFLDSDMTFPPDTALRLLRHKVDIVAANCVTRSSPANTTARLKWDEAYYQTTNEGLQEVEFVGTGVMLIRARVFNALSMPFFNTRWVEEREHIMGEDWFFLEKARSAGFKVFVDNEISWEIKHIGSYAYSMDNVEFPEGKKQELSEFIRNAVGTSS